MAEDKKDDAEEPAKKKKGPLMPLLLVVVGALLGAAGVVFGMPPPKPEDDTEHHQVVLKRFVQDDKDREKFSFNPQTESGKALAQVSFKLVYQCREDEQEEVREILRSRLSAARSKVLLILKSRHVDDLQSDRGIERLQEDLADALTHVFFGTRDQRGDRKIDAILWDQIIVH